MLRYRHVAQCGLMVSDRSRGRVRGVPGAPLVRYDLCREDTRDDPRRPRCGSPS